MMRSTQRFLCAALATLTLSLVSVEAHASQQAKHTFVVQGGKFLLDGKPFQIISGEMHPSRIPKEYWRHRIRMAKAMGLNAIAPYIFWNIHEPEKGKFNFKADADIARFVKICQEEGMYVLVRPGPYVCAEWEFGGYPYWLLNEKGMTIRADDARFLDYSRKYLQALAKETAPLQITKGGNIILVQVENEYGSYGSDHTYMAKVRDMIKEVGYDVPLFVAEGGGQLAGAWVPGTVAGVNGGGGPGLKETVDKYTPGGPYMVPEFYPGWLDHWGEPKSITEGGVKSFDWLINHDASVNLYMFHGGTNFGFMNGANFGGAFAPSITSYDYDAPLDEAGRPRKKFFGFRDSIARHLGKELPAIPATNPVVEIPRFKLTQSGSLFGTLPKPVHSETTKNMEELGQAYGYVLYRTRVTGPQKSTLQLKDLRDFAVVLVNGKTVGTLDRRRKQQTMDIEIPAGGATLDLLVENGGRINYGGKIPDNHKGITEKVLLAEEELKGWDMYSLPMLNPEKVKLDGANNGGPSFYKGTFNLEKVGDAFLDMRGWTKGIVFVNGHNLGRYWWIGPQQTLYVPGPWLRKGKNDITVFEMLKAEDPSVAGLAEPILTDLRKEPPIEANKRPRVKLEKTPKPTEADQVLSATLSKDEGPQTFKFAEKSGRYLCFEALSSYAGEDFESLAELELVDANGKALNRSKWKIAFTDSEEVLAEDGSADNLLDGDADSIWHSIWSAPHSGAPHRIVIDLGAEVQAAGIRLLPRQHNTSSHLKEFKVYFSSNPFDK